MHAPRSCTEEGLSSQTWSVWQAVDALHAAEPSAAGGPGALHLCRSTESPGLSSGEGGVAPGSGGTSKIYFLAAVVPLSGRETSPTPRQVAAACTPRPSTFSFAHRYLESHLLLEAFLFRC